MVETQFGAAAWTQVVEACELDDDEHFKIFEIYSDSCTMCLFKAVAETVGTNMDQILRTFGNYFLTYSMEHGHENMVTTLGGDLVTFVENLDSMHSLLSLTYTGLVAPSFRCIKQADGTLILHYYSVREGLHPMVEGIVRAVGWKLFKQNAILTLLTQKTEHISKGTIVHHTEYKVRVSGVHAVSEDKRQQKLSVPTTHPRRPSFEDRAHNPGTASLIRAEDFNLAFPFHILMDRFLFIRQCGDSIQKLSMVPVESGTPFKEVGVILEPAIAPTTDNIFMFLNSVFVVAIHTQDSDKPFILKGQMIWLPHCFHLLFMGSPRLTALEDLRDMKVFLSDVPIYDVTRELVFLNPQRMSEMEAAKKLEQTTYELKKLGKALQQETATTEEMLHEVMPVKVARHLTAGLPVPPERYEMCTVQFSHVVTFTKLISRCPADAIVSMLDNIYFRFDQHAHEHNVYKVDTLGDAYMAVTGVPETQEDNAERMAAFAMDMIEDAGQVMSPDTGKPLKIRVGMHSGWVIAGVIGKERPRYDIYGDTVNTASRMTSDSVPGRIHVSPTTFQLLYPRGYRLKCRGDTEVRGKGLMKTYFLVGHGTSSIPQPDDDFARLEDLVHQSPAINPQTTWKARAVSTPVLPSTRKSSMASEESPPPRNVQSIVGNQCLSMFRASSQQATNDGPDSALQPDCQQQPASDDNSVAL